MKEFKNTGVECGSVVVFGRSRVCVSVCVSVCVRSVINVNLVGVDYKCGVSVRKLWVLRRFVFSFFPRP